MKGRIKMHNFTQSDFDRSNNVIVDNSFRLSNEQKHVPLGINTTPSWALDTHSSIGLSMIEEIFFIDSEKEVVLFLRNNSFLIPIILNAAIEIKRTFDIPFSLKLDYEGIDDKLYLLIVCADYDNSFDSLKRLDNNWWLQHVGKAKGKMNIDLELV